MKKKNTIYLDKDINTSLLTESVNINFFISDNEENYETINNIKAHVQLCKLELRIFFVFYFLK